MYLSSFFLLLNFEGRKLRTVKPRCYPKAVFVSPRLHDNQSQQNNHWNYKASWKKNFECQGGRRAKNWKCTKVGQWSASRFSCRLFLLVRDH